MLLISDANILIDMAEAGLLTRMFSLPTPFAVPDVLFAEELSDRHPGLPGLGLRLLTLGGAGVAEAYRLKQLTSGRDAPSQNDLFALLLARQEDCPLLSGDRRLRQLAAAHLRQVDVRGTLWLMEQLKDHGLITTAEARTAYERMKQSGSRLPWAEVDRQLDAWEALESQPAHS